MIRDGSSELNIEQCVALALEIGFSAAAPLAMDSLVTREEVRAMCAANRCNSYGKNWSCPPAAGSIIQAERRISNYNSGIIVQTSGGTDGEFDILSISEIRKKHTENFDTLVRQIKTIYPKAMPMGAGACSRCYKCTYPNRPCRYPDRIYPSMEAYGLLVSDVCLRSGLKYNYGEHTMTFTSCILVRTEEKGYQS